MSSAWGAVPSLAAGALGCLFAFLIFRDFLPLVIAIIAIALVASWAIFKSGASLATKRPALAANLMEAWLIVPIIVGAAASTAVILIAVGFEPSQNASVETKKLSAAIVAALGAFITASFLKALEAADEGIVGSQVAGAFARAFAQCKSGDPADRQYLYFPPGSDGANCIFSDFCDGEQGWGFKARRKRSQCVQRELPGASRIPAGRICP